MSNRIISSHHPLLQTVRRTLLAIVGGYALSALCAIGLAWLPLSRVDAVIVGMFTSFAIYTAFVIWAFAGRPIYDTHGHRVGKAHFRQSMSWLHTWSGLLASWILFSIFVAGSAAYYRVPITDWMQPERLLALQAEDSATADTDGALGGALGRANAARRNMALAAAQQTITTKALQRLNQVAPHANRWSIVLPDGAGTLPEIKWQDGKTQKMQVETLSAGSNASNTATVNGSDTAKSSTTETPAEGASKNRAVSEPRATEGGDFFYTFHYALHYVPPIIGEWIVGAATMFMLVASISGIVTHRRIFVDFFTFRPKKGLRSWMDGHIVSAVLVLPYHLMITYSGLVLLMLSLMPWPMQARYPGPGGLTQFYADAYDYRVPGEARGQAAPLTAILPLLQQAQQHFAGESGDPAGPQLPATVTIDHPGDVSATVKFDMGIRHRLSVSQETITFNGVTGKRIALYDTTPVRTTAGSLMGLHQAYFAPAFVRALFFLSGLCGAVMVATGLVMWTNRYRQKHLNAKNLRAPFGVRLVEHLNIGTIGGMPIAVASYFWANRLLSPTYSTRSDWEVRIFFIVWAVAMVHPLLRKGYRAWREQFWLGAALFALLPLLDRWMIGTWVMPGFDIVCAALGALLALIACYVRPRQQRKPPRPAVAVAHTSATRTETVSP